MENTPLPSLIAASREGSSQSHIFLSDEPHSRPHTSNHKIYSRGSPSFLDSKANFPGDSTLFPNLRNSPSLSSSPVPAFSRPATRMRPSTTASHSTQLAEKVPQIGVPQRLEPPIEFNSPVRCTVATANEKILSKIFSPSASRAMSRKRDSRDNKSQATSSPLRNMVKKSDNHYRLKIRDMEILSRSSHRAGMSRNEAFTMYNRGVLHDNMREYTKALKCYKQYLNLCQSISKSQFNG